MPQQKSANLEERQRKILQAAREVFKADGNLDGGLRRIAAAAGYTTGAIYKMFSGKEDIYAALLEESLIALGQKTALAAATHADPEEALRASALEFLNYYQNNDFEYRLGLYMFDTDGSKGLGAERDAKLNQLLERSMGVFQACFQRVGQGQIQEDRARDLAHALFATIAGVLAIHFSGRDKSLKTSWQKILDLSLSSLIGEANR